MMWVVSVFSCREQLLIKARSEIYKSVLLGSDRGGCVLIYPSVRWVDGEVSSILALWMRWKEYGGPMGTPLFRKGKLAFSTGARTVVPITGHERRKSGRDGFYTFDPRAGPVGASLRSTPGPKYFRGVRLCQL